MLVWNQNKILKLGLQIKIKLWINSNFSFSTYKHISNIPTLNHTLREFSMEWKNLSAIPILSHPLIWKKFPPPTFSTSHQYSHATSEDDIQSNQWQASSADNPFLHPSHPPLSHHKYKPHKSKNTTSPQVYAFY